MASHNNLENRGEFGHDKLDTHVRGAVNTHGEIDTHIADTSKHLAAGVAWTAPSLTNSWVNYGSDLGNAYYMKDGLGFVHLRGVVKNGTGSIFTLPTGCRPASTVLFLVPAGTDAPARCDIHTDGTVNPVYFTGATNAYFTLDGILFPAA